MKFAFMSFSTPQLSLEETLELAVATGYQGIEPRTDRSHGHGIELERTAAERKEIAKKVDESGMSLCALASGLRLATSANPKFTYEQTRLHLELAHDIGARCLRVFGGTIEEGVSREEAIASLSEILALLAPDAEAAGVPIAVETHDAWCDPAYLATVMQQVAHPMIKVTWDMMHPRRSAGVSIPDAWRILAPWVIHTHIHDGTLADPLRILPCGTGEIGVSEFLTVLKEANYRGFISGEWPDCEGIIDLKTERCTMEQLAKAATIL